MIDVDDPADLAMWRKQDMVHAVTDRIDAAGGGLSCGYAGMIVAEKDLTVNLWWKGTVPNAVTAIIEDPTHGVTVRLLPAAHDREEMTDACHLLLRSATVDLRMTDVGLDIHAVSYEQDGSGVRIHFQQPPDGATLSARAIAAARLAATVAGFPVTAAHEGPPATFARWTSSTLAR